MIRRPLISHYNAPYRGPKDKKRINSALNSIKIDILNIKKYALYLNSKVVSIFKNYLMGGEDNEHDQFNSDLKICMVINDSVEEISSLDITNTNKMTAKMKECDMQLDFMLNDVSRKYKI